jgi:hypothetical protein
MKDRLVWAETNNGQFSVRSAYYLELDRMARQHRSGSVFPSTRSCWKLLWHLKIPRSVQLFLWRVCNDILPTKEKLWKRRIVENPLWSLCGTEVESSIHAVWLCDATKSVWSICQPWIQKCISGDIEFLSLFGNLSARLELEDLELFAMVSQWIWFRRNRYVFDGVFIPPSCLIKGAKEALIEYREAHDSTFLNIQQRPPLLSHQWSKPPQGSFKLNWDAALDRKHKLIGVRIVARDSEGKVLMARCSYQRYISDSSMAEAYGAKLCAEFGLFLGLQSVVLEGDALEVVKALSRVDEDMGNFGNLIGETSILLRNYDRLAVNHVRREGNMVAHNLAKLAVSHPQNQVWFDSFPSCLSELVSSELCL